MDLGVEEDDVYRKTYDISDKVTIFSSNMLSKLNRYNQADGFMKSEDFRTSDSRHEDTTEHSGHERIDVSGSEGDSKDPDYIIESITDNDDYCNDDDLYMDEVRCDILNEQIGEDRASVEK
ncbi:hypothetical protein M9H77_36355 [Catharanthus roseus]|uniref:Uncharacterized protein n=1 Tax=Catharanthus roseus TaxID=4058 RepID=A0ACB9ZVA7_CATRO|nr:hypothetical protein M9H77_36355 [Catharanthus roseus]